MNWRTDSDIESFWFELKRFFPVLWIPLKCMGIDVNVTLEELSFGNLQFASYILRDEVRSQLSRFYDSLHEWMRNQGTVCTCRPLWNRTSWRMKSKSFLEDTVTVDQFLVVLCNWLS